MRGDDQRTAHLFSYVSPEERVPADHPLRAIRALTDEALRTMSPHLAGLYARTGRPSIPPEQLLRALLLQVLYTVRSERLLMEELHYNLLFRWFVGMNMDDPVWHPTTFSKMLVGRRGGGAVLRRGARPGAGSGAVCTDILYFRVRLLATYCPWPRRGESGQEGCPLRTPTEAEPREAKILACPSERTVFPPASFHKLLMNKDL